MTRLETFTGFNPNKMADYFAKRDWPVTFLPQRESDIVRVTRGAALECGDGRFDKLDERKIINGEEVHGIRVFGGINAIMAILTGGDEIGLERATKLIKRFGATPGTHSADEGGCGFADLWIAGNLESAIYPYELSEIDRGSLRLGNWLANKMSILGGKHFRLNGNHEEEAVRINPFKRQTEASKDGSRFRVDDWFMAELGVPDEVRWNKIAEATEKLKADAAKLEIIVTNSWYNNVYGQFEA